VKRTILIRVNQTGKNIIDKNEKKRTALFSFKSIYPLIIAGKIKAINV